MAEIKIKKKQPRWLLILVALAILALVYLLFFKNNDVVNDTADDVKEMVSTDKKTSNNKDDEVLSDWANSKVSEYKAYVANGAKMGMNHTYSNGALTRLIDATDAIANSLGVTINADLKKARSDTASITNDSNEVDHANKIIEASSITVQALKKIQTQKYPNLDSAMEELENAVAAISPDKKVLEQKETINDFFIRAEELLTNMKNN